MKVSKKEIFNYYLMFINIFLGVFLIIDKLKKQKILYFQIAIFFGVLGFYFRPYLEDYDIAGYYRVFDEIQLLSQYKNYQKDIYATSLISIIYNLNLPRYFLGLISAFIVYYFYYKSLAIIMLQKKTNYIRNAVLLYLSIPIIGFTGIRFLPAAAICTYGIINIEILKKNKKGFFLMIISTFFHSSMYLSCIVMLFKYIIKIDIKILKRLPIICFAISIFIKYNPQIIIQLIDILNKSNLINIKTSTYITGNWGLKYIEMFTGIAKYYRVYLVWILQLILLVLSTKIHNNKFILIFANICIFFLPFQTLFERYFLLISILSLLLSFKKIKRDVWTKVYYKVSFGYGMLIFLREVYDHRFSLVLSYQNLIKLSLFNIFQEIINKIF